MPVPIIKKIKFDPEGGPISVELTFKTFLLCAYSLDLRMKETNDSVDGYPKQGDNSNPEDDKYTLPKPASRNRDRSLWAITTVINQSGNKETYEIVMDVFQDGKKLDTMTTGKKELEKNNEIEIFAAKLVC